MSAHTEEEFNLFLSQLKETNQTLDFFCDFEKINNNVEDIKLSLCILNSMIGSTDLRKSVETIWNRDKVMRCFCRRKIRKANPESCSHPLPRRCQPLPVLHPQSRYPLSSCGSSLRYSRSPVPPFS